MKKAYSKEEVAHSLWNAYEKTPEYKSGLKAAIFEDHKLIRDQEKQGLKAIYTTFVNRLLSTKIQKEELLSRNENDWLSEWKDMHKKLYGHIIRKSGMWREENVRFGSPGDEEKNIYNIPTIKTINNEIYHLANQMKSYLSRDRIITSPFTTLAQFHYQFIRVHPFLDGNGRIARAVTDQLAVYFGYPPAMGGYPRHDQKKREAYHKAIRACVEDNYCSDLASWIRNYIETQINNMA